MVCRFIGGLRQQLQTAMAQCDPSTVDEAHRRAATFKQQSRSSNWNQSATRSKSHDTTGNSASASTKEATDSGTTKPGAPEEQTLRRSSRTNALRCYSCGEAGHRQTACPHATRRGLLMDEQHNELEVYDSQEEEEALDDEDIHQTAGDTGHVLVLRRSCIIPRRTDDQWLRTNIFCVTCTINVRICTFVIDSGSSQNVIS